jgi:hypothetical protein
MLETSEKFGKLWKQSENFGKFREMFAKTLIVAATKLRTQLPDSGMFIPR